MLTNSVAVAPLSTTAMLPPGIIDVRCPAKVLTTLPFGSSTSRQPGPLVPVVPSWLGVLPTMIQPVFSMVNAVDSPMPPGQDARWRGMVASVVSLRVLGLKSTIVVPRPCRLAALLKFVIRTSFFCTLPADTGATITAYGFWSPFGAMVEVTTVWRWIVSSRPAGWVAASAAIVAPLASSPAARVIPQTAV